MNIIDSRSALRAGVSLAFVLSTAVFCGCGGSDPTSASTAPGVAAEGHPAAVAKVALDDNGKSLEFYELGGGVLIGEEGPAVSAPMAPAYRDLIKAGRLVDLVSQLRPDLPVPREVVELQLRHPPAAVGHEGTGPGKVGATSTLPVAVGARAGSGDQSGGDKLENTSGRRTPNACNNGCCDPTYTRNTLCNLPFVYENYSWYNFDYGWGWANGNENSYWGTACSAIGTSNYNVWILNGPGGNWSIPEGWYHWFEFEKGGGDITLIMGQVNDENHMHLHTYCGEMGYVDP
jgi:hypothetical protein